MARKFSEKNLLLKNAIKNSGKSMKEVSEDMTLSKDTFNKKINNRISGCTMYAFSFCEKFYLSVMFGVAIKDIE